MEEGIVRHPTAGTPQGRGDLTLAREHLPARASTRRGEREGARYGTLVRYADDFVVMCDTKRDVERALARVRRVLAWLGLELHPEKTRTVDLSLGNQGFDFLGCHLRKRMSGPIWARERRRVYFLQREPSKRSMQRVRQRVKDATSRRRSGVKDVRVIVGDPQSRAPGLGAVLPHRQRREAIQPARLVRLAVSHALHEEAQGTPLEAGRSG